MKKVVFLYTELADYFLKCLAACGNNFQFLVIHWPVNKEAPFKLIAASNTQLIDKSSHSFRELIQIIEAFQPDLINCSGWIDKDYIRIAKHFKLRKTKTSISIDNHWDNSLKQKMATLLSHFTIRHYFNMAWVPGEAQKTYALKLGFKSEQIHLGFYCADTSFFNAIYEKRNSAQQTKSSPKVFLFVARYVKHKGIFDLWQAFIRLKTSYPNDWELWCIGTGEEWDHRIEHPHIKHFGFKQPNDLLPYLLDATVYVLPSHFEPWGVSVHEMALSGFPLILSDRVGASEYFLDENKNGFKFHFQQKDALTKALKSMMDLDANQLSQMSQKSHEMGNRLRHQNWKATLEKMVLQF
jgi:glycosyltransferase involved in cell wall biosynthesis